MAVKFPARAIWVGGPLLSWCLPIPASFPLPKKSKRHRRSKEICSAALTSQNENWLLILSSILSGEPNLARLLRPPQLNALKRYVRSLRRTSATRRLMHKYDWTQICDTQCLCICIERPFRSASRGSSFTLPYIWSVQLSYSLIHTAFQHLHPSHGPFFSPTYL